MATVECPIHGEQPADGHHIVPKFYGGEDCEDNKAPVCRLCHQNLHAGDLAMKRQGWLALVDKLGSENVSEYMSKLAKRRIEKKLKQVGEEGLAQMMREVANKRWAR